MGAPEAELINEFEFQHYGFSPAGFTDSIYNCAVDSWQEAVEEVFSNDRFLGQATEKKKFMAEVTGMIFSRKEVREAFKTFTDRVLKYILRIPPYVTLPEHQATHELLLSGEPDVEEIESECKKLEDEIVEERFILSELSEDIQEGYDVIEVLKTVIKKLEDDNSGSSDVGAGCDDFSNANASNCSN